MIYLCTAMYIEAEMFINKLHLKKDTSITKFQVFKNEHITLIITGVSKLKACIALTYLLSNKKINSSDFIINIGLCGTTNRNLNIGETFLCNKIIDNDSKKTYFSDILFKHPFKENSIETCSKTITSNNNIEAELVDMESSGIYESALTFVEAHQIVFIKIISDYLNVDKIDTSKLKTILNNSSDIIINWINTISSTFKYSKNIFTSKDIENITKISTNLKFSTTMKNEFKQILKYNNLLNGNFKEIINESLELQCNSKKEGKMYLEKLKQKYI